MTARTTDPSAGDAPPADPEACRLQGLVVDFGTVRAVAGLDLAVLPGRVLALVGGNGAGKSTTLRVLAGVVPPTEGSVRIGGVEVTRDPIRAKQMTGYCPDVGGLVPGATPWEHLLLSARLRRLEGWEERARSLLRRFELADVADRVTAGFSHGMSRRMSVVLAAAHEPSLVLLDEPFDGVDPLGVDSTLELIGELRAAGATVLISTHLLHLAVSVADEAVVLRGGRAVGHLAASELSGAEGPRSTGSC